MCIKTVTQFTTLKNKNLFHTLSFSKNEQVFGALYTSTKQKVFHVLSALTCGSKHQRSRHEDQAMPGAEYRRVLCIGFFGMSIVHLHDYPFSRHNFIPAALCVFLCHSVPASEWTSKLVELETADETHSVRIACAPFAPADGKLDSTQQWLKLSGL